MFDFFKKDRVKFSTKIPDVFYKCKEKFGVEWDMGARGFVIIPYGDTIYSKYKPSPHEIVHEVTHLRQQKEIGGPEIWWDKYLNDGQFRLEQEVEAYKNQIEFARINLPRQQRRELQKRIYKILSTTYGDICTSEEQAQELLK